MQADKNTSIFLKSYDRSKWETVKLGDIVEIISGGTPKTDTVAYWDGDIPWCTPTDITSNSNKYIHRTERNITEKGLANSAARLLPKNTLLLCSRATIGAVKIAGQSMCTNQGFKNLVCKEKISHEFLFYYIPKLKAQMLSQASGSTFLEISKAKLANIELEIPCDIEEQNFIANTLAAIDNHINNLESKISKYENIKKSTEKKLLTPKADWQQVRLGDIVDYYKGCGLSKEKLSSNGNYPCILYGELFTKYNEIIDEVQSKTFITEGFSSCYDDVLLPGSTTTCGEDLIKASAILQDDVLLGGDIIVLRPNKRLVCGRFLAYLISQYKKDMLKYTQGITIIHLQGHKMMDLQIKIPNLVVQRDIVNNIIKIDEHLKQLRYSLDKLCNIKTGMMSYFFG